ncbi:S1C family serine protease [Pirellulimonas nuda]|uniref:S1C family serine protease n=1 Tax=Pirellulimonas nuda TaxID=2528009 RepID=UPI0018D42BF6|nr:trypsin-like peptidase domain-containing protein [Pirellulimonas nuda]
MASLLLAAVLLPAAPVWAQAPADAPADGLAELKRRDAAMAALIERVEPSVVAVSQYPADAGAAAVAARNPDIVINVDPFGAIARPSEPEPTVVGAGVVVAPGKVLTQYLVGTGGRVAVTNTAGDRFDARLLAADPRSGLAVLDVGEAEGAVAGLTPIPLGRAEDVRKGQSVLVVSNPQAIESDGQPSASLGMVTNLAAKLGADINLNDAADAQGGFRSTLHHFGTLIQTDARIGYGSSGGALVNLDGELVGIITSAAVSAGHESAAGYAIPLSPPIRRVLEALLEGREAEYGLLGIQFNALSTSATAAGEAGVAVDRTFPGSPAAAAGLIPGDVIVEVAGERIDSPDRLQLVVQGLGPGAQAPVEFFRNSTRKQTVVALGKATVQGRVVVTNRPPAWRGIRVDYATALAAEELNQATQMGLIDPEGCVLVSDVDPESGSWEAGVRPGMFVSHVGETRVSTPAEFAAATAAADASVKLRFTQQVQPPEAGGLRTF